MASLALPWGLHWGMLWVPRSPPCPDRDLRHRLLLLLTLVLSQLGLQVGCAHPHATGEEVRSIHFRGNGGAFAGTSDYNLRGAMAQQPSGSFAWLAPSRRVLLDRDTLDLDAWRLETWYAHRGFYDARFRAWDVITVRQGGARRNPAVRIVGYVEPGPESLVRTLDLAGMDAAGRPVVALLQGQIPIRVGERFDLGAVQSSVLMASQRLQEQGYAYATVEPHIQAHPEEQAVDVVLQAQLGPTCTFGPVEVVGDIQLPRERVLQEIDIEEGEPFQLSRLAATQQKLFSLGTFSVVNVVPDLQRDADGNPNPVVPVRIVVSESHFRQLRLGGGIALENARQELHVGAHFTHVNVLNRLWRLEVGTDAGYASVLQWSELRAQGITALATQGSPTLSSLARLTIPRFPARAWRWENELTFDLGVETEYRYATPQASTTLAWQMSRKWSSRYGYRISYFDYFDSTLPSNASLFDARSSKLGLAFSDPYVLSLLFQQLKYDSRDDLLYPRRGAYSVLDVEEAGGPVGGQYNFIKGTVDFRLYRPLPRIFGWRQRITVTGRIAGGAAVPYGGDSPKANVPFAERIFVGGSNSVRGFTRDHLGPYLYRCGLSADNVSQACTSTVGDIERALESLTYIGGRAALYGGVELRGYWMRGLLDNWGVAVFSDFGRAWDGAGVTSWKDLQARLSQIAVTAGAGVRYRSGIGPIRVDVARRMDTFPMFSLEPRYTAYIGLSEAW